jgi:hypothetical protein
MHRCVPDAVFLDRDGTIAKAAKGEYITRPEPLRLLPAAGKATRTLSYANVLCSWCPICRLWRAVVCRRAISLPAIQSSGGDWLGA